MAATAFVLAKDEEPNIGRSVSALLSEGIPTTVLDSGSSDATPQIAEGLGAKVVRYAYQTHAEAYRHVCVDLATKGAAVFVLDADMIISKALVEEALGFLHKDADVVQAPIRMCWGGHPLRHASLCPPKPFLFRGGEHYFVPAGHGERLKEGVRVAETTVELLHDDRKSLAAYLAAQVRYAKNFVERAEQGQLTARDRVRATTPVLLFGTPLVSYLLKGGLLDGWAGVGYALDRLIAEAIMFRESIARRVPPGK
jgi:hypothetical protein